MPGKESRVERRQLSPFGWSGRCELCRAALSVRFVVTSRRSAHRHVQSLLNKGPGSGAYRVGRTRQRVGRVHVACSRLHVQLVHLNMYERKIATGRRDPIWRRFITVSCMFIFWYTKSNSIWFIHDNVKRFQFVLSLVSFNWIVVWCFYREVNVFLSIIF